MSGAVDRPSVEARDLVEEHLAGPLDATLAGFVVLADHVLHDARDGGQVWFQDPETREVERGKYQWTAS